MIINFCILSISFDCLLINSFNILIYSRIRLTSLFTACWNPTILLVTIWSDIFITIYFTFSSCNLWALFNLERWPMYLFSLDSWIHISQSLSWINCNKIINFYFFIFYLLKHFDIYLFSKLGILSTVILFPSSYGAGFKYLKDIDGYSLFTYLWFWIFIIIN